MVFPGRFSTGCLRCRQRKVKCDEGKPSCRRCYIYGKECPGYTDQFHFRHGVTPSNFEKSATKSATKSSPKGQSVRLNQQQRRKSSASSRATQTPKAKEEDEKTTSTSTSISTSPIEISWSVKPMPSPKISYDDVSLCYFVRRFVSPDSTDGLPGHLTFLPGMYDHYGSSVLELATQSVAKMAAYNAFGGEEFRLQSYQTYGRAIKSLQDAIQDDQQATDDKTLASILLLCTMKDISGDGAGDPSEHAPGLYYLLERRGMEQLATRRGGELFLLSLVRLQVYSFLREDDIYSDPGGMAGILSIFDPLIRAMSMMSRTLSLRHQLSKYVPFPNMMRSPGAVSQPPPPYDSQDEEGHAQVIQSCLELLEEFDIWDAEAASYWKSMFEGRVLPTTLGEVGGRMSYCDPQTACTIILVRSARLIMVLSILTYHASMQLAEEDGPGLMGDSAAWTTWIPTLQADVHRTIDDILACVPFALGDLDSNGEPTTMTYDGASAIMIHQPLRLLTYCAYARPDQVVSAQKILYRINGGIGIRSAVSFDVIQAQMEALDVQGSSFIGGDGCSSKATATTSAVGLGIL